jgi:hypothetical protein
MNKTITQLANIWANRRAEDEKLGITYTFSEKALVQFVGDIVEVAALVANKDQSNPAGCGWVTKTTGDRIKEYFNE